MDYIKKTQTTTMAEIEKKIRDKQTLCWNPFKTKFRNTLKPMITVLSALALCYSTLSYAGDEKAKDATPSKSYFYTGANEDKSIRFEQSIFQNSPAFAVALALKIHAPDIYRVLQDTKTYMFQKNQIALMQDVLEELKAVNQNWMQQHRDWALQTYAPAVFELTAKLTKLAEETSFHAGKTVANDSNSEDIARLPVGSVTPQSRIGEAIADYFTNQLAKQNALFAKHGTTELPMQPKTKVADWSKMPEMKAGDDSIQVPHFEFVHANDFMACCYQVLTDDNCWNLLKALNQQIHQKKSRPGFYRH